MNNSTSTKRIILSGTQKPFLERNEQLVRYYNDIRRYEPLTPEETNRLFKLFHEGTKREREVAKTKLFNHNTKLVVSMARKYCSNNDNLMDLIEEGNIGLLNAIEQYRMDKDSSFAKYALYHIRREINLFKVNYTPIIKQTNRSKTDNVVSNITKAFIQKEQRKPTADELLEAYNEISKKEKKVTYNEDMLNVEYVYIDSLDGEKTDDLKDGQSFLDYTSKSACANNYLKQIIDEHNEEVLNVFMADLNPKEKKAIRLFYGLENGIEESLCVIASRLGCTSERVRQLCANGLSKMQDKASKMAYRS